MQVSRWTKDGWKSSKATKEQVKNFTSFRSRTPMSLDSDIFGQRSELNLLSSDISEEIMYGDPGSKIDSTPKFLRQITDATDAFYLRGNKLYKVVDPITQAKTSGAGVYEEEKDFEILDQIPSMARRFVEDAGLIDKDEICEDILGEVADEYQVSNSPFATRANINLDRIINAYGELDEADKDSIYDEDDYSVSKTDWAGYLPELPEDAVEKVRRLDDERKALLSIAKNNEDLVIETAFDRALDECVGKFISTKLNSPYCGRGYSAPDKQYVPIIVDQESTIATAAIERKNFFREILSQAAACETMDDLFGKIQLDNRKFITLGVKHNNENDANELDQIPNPQYGKYCRIGGFVSSIRGMYQHDKEIVKAWSTRDTLSEAGEVISKSAFTIAREAKEKELVNKEYPQDKIDKILWVLFDRRARKSEYKKWPNGKLFLKGKVRPVASRAQKDSVWYQNQAIAFQDLFLTKKQWATIYSMVDTIKARAKMDPKNPTRIETLDLLAKYFGEITNLSDLNSYMKWAQKRQIIEDKIVPSKIDVITIRDEYKWRASCTKKRTYIISRMVKFQAMRDSVISERPTNLPEQSISCMDPKCDCMAIGQPIWFEIEPNKGLNGIRCDGCGKITWLVDHKEEIVLKEFQLN